MWRVEFHAKASAETVGLPAAAYSALIRALQDVARDPWAGSNADEPAGDHVFRWVSFDRGLGVVELVIDDARRVVRVHGITWTG